MLPQRCFGIPLALAIILLDPVEIAANVAPNSPANPSPASGVSNRPINQTLTWQCTDPDGDALTYDVYFGPPFGPTLVASNLPAPTYNPGVLAFSSTYWWRITARDPSGATTTGATWIFTTKANTVPTIGQFPNNPGNNWFAQSAPQLRWPAGSDPDAQTLTYDIYFGTTNPPPLIASGLTGTMYMAPEWIETTQYYWRVSVSDGIATTMGNVWTYIAAVPGDVNHDGELTLEDADCALNIGIGLWGCGGMAEAGLADIGCEEFASPRDAAVIHHYVLGGDFICPGPPPVTPVITETAEWIDDDALNIILSVENVPHLEAFAFSINVHGWGPLLEALPIGATTNFTDIAVRSSGSGGYFFAVVGGYALDPVDATTRQQLIHLRFGINPNPYQIVIQTFKDDLAGAPLMVVGTGPITAAKPLPVDVSLGHPHPNPFNPQTIIPYSVPAGPPARVRLAIYDTVGRIVRVLVDEEQDGGAREVVWRGDDHRGASASSGVYYCVLQVGSERRTQKLVLLK